MGAGGKTLTIPRVSHRLTGFGVRGVVTCWLMVIIKWPGS